MASTLGNTCNGEKGTKGERKEPNKKTKKKSGTGKGTMPWQQSGENLQPYSMLRHATRWCGVGCGGGSRLEWRTVCMTEATASCPLLGSHPGQNTLLPFNSSLVVLGLVGRAAYGALDFPYRTPTGYCKGLDHYMMVFLTPCRFPDSAMFA